MELLIKNALKWPYDNIIWVVSPLIITDQQIDEIIEIVRKTWKKHN
jgi:adenosylmethionine-8-amino-7-oxononanoate aminotransferase